MSEEKDHMSIRTKKLNLIVDDIFDVFECIHEMLQDWKCDYHTSFIEQVMKLKKLESELYALGYDEVYALMINRIVYQSVFPEHVRSSYERNQEV